MKRKYSKRQLVESIKYWENVLLQMNESSYDLGRSSKSMTSIIEKNWQILMDLNLTKEELIEKLRQVFEENNLSTPATNRLLMNVKMSKNLQDALLTIVNSKLYGNNLGVNGARRAYHRY